MSAPILRPSVKQAAADEDAKPTNYLIGPEAALPTRDELLGPPYQPPMIVEGYLQQDAGGVVAPGETGKSTLMIYEAVHVILGRDLYGKKIARAGAALYITAEDERAAVMGRLNDICRALELSEKEQRKVLKGFYTEDVSARPAKLVEGDRFGVRRTAFADEIIAKYKDSKLAVVVLDPTSLLGPGEQCGNDGMAELMRTARMLSQGLGAAVRVVHHVSQAVARSDTWDQYAGRGGTAFADNSRSQHQIVKLTGRKLKHEGSEYMLPATVTDDALAGERGMRVLAIFLHKLSYGVRDPAPIILVRNRFAFMHVPVERTDRSPMADAIRLENDREKVLGFIVERFGAGIKVNRRDLDSHAAELGMIRDELRDACASLLGMGLLVERPLPANERSTKRTKYLAPAGEPNLANCAESRGIAPRAITNTGTSEAANCAADGTSIRRRNSKVKKRPRLRGQKKAAPGLIAPNPATSKRLNGKAAPHV
jgi:hypothetical protein